MTARSIKRVWRIQSVIQLSAMMAMIVHMQLQLRGLIPHLTLYDGFVWIAIMFAIIAWRFWRVGRLRRRAEACGYLLCDDCTYDLRGVETGVCPECGEAFTAGTLKERWTEAGVRK